VHAVVLAFDDVLWFYVPGLGTSTLGPAPARSSATAAAIKARLRALDPGLAKIDVSRGALRLRTDLTTEPLTNGCFAGCLHRLAELLALGDPIDAAGIVFLSRDRGGGPGTHLLENLGHSLLVYRTRGVWTAFDPVRPESPLRLDRIEAEASVDPALLAYARSVHYATDRVQYLPFSPAALRRLGQDAQWIAFQIENTTVHDRLER
jgi:hypothetical protein